MTVKRITTKAVKPMKTKTIKRTARSRKRSIATIRKLKPMIRKIKASNAIVEEGGSFKEEVISFAAF